MSTHAFAIMPEPSSQQRRRPVNDDDRHNIIWLVISLGKTKAEVAKLLDRPYSTISTIVQTFLDTGRTQSMKKNAGLARRRSLVTDEHIQTIILFLYERPAATLLEINDHLEAHGGPRVSQSYMSRLLIKRCHYTLKRLHVEHDQHQSEDLIQRRQA